MMSHTRSPEGGPYRRGRMSLRARRLGFGPALLVCGAVAVLVGVLLICFPTAATAVPESTSTSLRLGNEAQGKVDSLATQADAVQNEIDALDVELEQATEQYNLLLVSLDQINVRLTNLRRDLAEAEKEHAQQRKNFEDRLVAVYKSGSRDQLLKILLMADGIDNFFERVRAISSLADQDKKLIAEYHDSSIKINALLKEIDGHKREELALRRQLEAQQIEVEAKLSERQTVLASINKDIEKVIEEERVRQQQEQEALRQRLLTLNDGQVYNGSLPQNDDEVLNQIVETAATYMGIPYVWAGYKPSTGFDCSGFTQFVFAQHGINLPHYSGYQAQMGNPVALEDIRAGDLVAFGTPVHHVGMYVGDGLFIHAPRTGDVVKLQPLAEKTNLSAIRRFPLQMRVGDPLVG